MADSKNYTGMGAHHSEMPKMAKGGTMGRPTTMSEALKRVEKTAADERLDRMAGVKEGSAKDIRADKLQA